jgi:hypothetical protein
MNNYPHWFGFAVQFDEETAEPLLAPIAALAKTRSEAMCMISAYAKAKSLMAPEHMFEQQLVCFDTADDMYEHHAGLDIPITILTFDDRGKCISFRRCDEPGGRCDVEYYQCGCFV